MKTRNLALFTFIVLILNSCMPDSFTKFKEDPPTKSEASGGSTSSGGTTTGGTTGGGSTPTPSSDVQYTISNVDFYQSTNDTLVFEVADGTGFSVGESVFVSEELFGLGKQMGTIVAVNVDDANSPRRILGLRLDGPQATDYDNNEGTTNDALYSSDTSTAPTKDVDINYYIDNCAGGFNSCPGGTSHVSVITSQVAFFIRPAFTSSGPYSSDNQKNFRKKIKINGGGPAGTVTSLRFNYSFSTGNQIGLGVQDIAASVALETGDTGDSNATNDRLMSPFGPFALPENTDFSTTPLTLNVSLHEDDHGSVLDPEEQASADIYLVSTIPGSAEQEATPEFELTYYIKNNQRFAVHMNNTSGFFTGQTVRSCRTTASTECDSDNELIPIEGRAVIEYVDNDSNVLYLRAVDFDHDGNVGTAMRSSKFDSGRFLHDAGGTFVATQTSPPSRIFRDSDDFISLVGTPEFTLSPSWNEPNDITDNPSGTLNISYSVDAIPAVGFSISPGTGEIEIDFPRKAVDVPVVISATNVDTNEVIDTYTLIVTFIGTPNGATFASNGTTNGSLTENIGIEATDAIHPTFDTNSSELDGEFIDYGKFVFNVTPALPAGARIVRNTSGGADITFQPTTYNSAGTTYAVDVFHPAYNADFSSSANAFENLTLTLRSATDFDDFAYPQPAGTRLILEVADASIFSTTTDVATVIDIPNISNERGGAALVTRVDTDNDLLFVVVDQDSAGIAASDVFKEEDNIDNTSSFVTTRTKINKVIHVYDVGTNLSITPEILLNGNPVTLDVGNGEVFSYAISPSPPADVTFNTVTGEFSGTAPFATLPVTTFTVSGVNEIGKRVDIEYTFVLSNTPSAISMGRYQFIRLSANTRKFYRGTKISNNNNSSVGKVLMPINVDSDSSSSGREVDGLLIEFDGDIADGWGIDNVTRYFGTEGTVVPYNFIDVKDISALGAITPGVTKLTTTAGDEALVETTPIGNRLYVRLNIGTFSSGETIFNGSNQTIINNVQVRHYATGVLEVNSQTSLDTLSVGGFISTSNTHSDTNDSSSVDASAIVLQKHYDFDAGKFYVIIQHLSGAFGERDVFDNTQTFVAQEAGGAFIRSIVGPVTRVAIAGHDTAGANPANFSSTNVAIGANSNEPFFEGSMIAGFDGTNTFLSSGFAIGSGYWEDDPATVPVDPRSYVLIQVDDFGTHLRHDKTASGGVETNYIDDFNEFYAGTMAAEAHNKITDVELSNTFVGYVGKPLHLEPTVQGEFSTVFISPDTLPNGLAFDTSSGRITGSPTEPAAAQTFTLNYVPTDGTSPVTYSFDLIVYNYFEISQRTTNASSYVLHQEGQGLGASNCRVLSSQVYDDVNDPRYGQASYGLNDIICYLEAGERDLFDAGIEFQIESGAGMCEFVDYTPYAFNQVPVVDSANSYVVYESFADATTCTTASGSAVDAGYINIDEIADTEFSVGGTLTVPGPPIVPGFGDGTHIPLAGRNFDQTYCNGNGRFCRDGEVAEPSCTFDYNEYDDNLPNVDEGFYDARTVTCEAVDEGSGVINCQCKVSEPVRKDCEGNNVAGVQGPVRDLFTDATSSSISYSSFNGLDSTVRVSPGTTGNRLSEDTDDASSIYSANYFDFNLFETGGNSLFQGTYNFDSYTAPGAVTDVRNQWASYTNIFDGLGSARGETFYTFRCLDAAGNPKARVRLMVRDWDREFTPTTEGAVAGSTAIEESRPTTNANPLLDSMDNTSTTACFGFPCNNHKDWTDLLLALAGNTRFEVNGLSPLSLSNGVGFGPAIEVTFSSGTNVATISSGTLLVADIEVGTVIEIITVGGFSIPARVRSVIPDGGTPTNVNSLEFEFVFPYVETTGLQIRIPRGVGYPSLDNF